MAQDTYDVIVIGAGSTGENVADRAVKGGLSAILVESELVGGDCSYWACVPSKALLRPGEAVHAARSVGGARQAVTGELNPAAVLDRRSAFASEWDDAGQVAWVESAGVDLVRGRARLTGDRQVEVTGGDGGSRVLSARQAVALCTGSEPAVPPIPGLADAAPWTTADAASATEVPARLAVIGGGVAGCELAQAFHSLGAEVTVVETSGRLLPGYEPFVGEHLARVFHDSGIAVHTGTTAGNVARAADGSVTLTLDGGGNGATVGADRVLAATGRAPATSDLGLEALGLKAGSWLDVDDTLRVRGVPGGWLYAAGDLNRRALLTHMGKYQARACGDVIAARARGEAADPPSWTGYTATADHGVVPQVVFTDPQVAAVGPTEAQAREAGLPVRAVDHSPGSIAGGALYADGYSGQARLLVDEERRVVVGATLVGPAVGELLHAATVAVAGEVPIDRLWHTVPCFPTISEIWLRLLETYGL